ncbi:MAG: hypothetical protein ACKOI2_10685 [Actinomycetota bacterium]
MIDRAALLHHAEQVLDGEVSVGSSGPRTAALLARCAFEDWLDEQSATWASTEYPSPSTRSKLVVLEVLGDREVGAQARWVWEALSRSVHHHAYELQPSTTEVRYLVEQVRQLGV